MLVLTRKRQEAVVVGAHNGYERMLKVTVLDIRGGKVKLGFEVDADVPVHRWEVWQRILTNGPPVADLQTSPCAATEADCALAPPRR